MKMDVKSEAIAHLLNEHRILAKLLASFDALLNRVEASRGGQRTDIAVLIDFMSEFSSLRHEEKEESLLLPTLERLGMAWDDGPLAYARREHRQERYLIRSMRQSCQQKDEWDEEDRRHFVAIGREFVAFTRRHMQNEEDFLFPEANVRLPPDVDKDLVAHFAALDRELDSVPDSKALQARAEGILEQFAAAEPNERSSVTPRSAAWREPH